MEKQDCLLKSSLVEEATVLPSDLFLEKTLNISSIKVK